MPQYGWECCGEGFSGVQKFRNLITGVKEIANCGQETEIESLIQIDRTPDKTRHLKRRKVSVKAHRKNVAASNVAKGGHEQEFLSDFKDVLEADKKASQPDDIHWSSSSSDELQVDQSAAQNVSHSSVQSKKRCLKVNKGHMHQTANEISRNAESGSHLQKSEVNKGHMHQTANEISRNAESGSHLQKSEKAIPSQTNCNADSAAHQFLDKHADPRRNLKVTWRTLKQNQDPDVRWSESSFQVASNNAVPKAAESPPLKLHKKLKQPVRPNVVRRLKIFEDENSLEEISDVDSSGDDRDDDAVEDNDVSDFENAESGQPDLLQQSEIISGTSISSQSTEGEIIKASDWVLALQKQKTPVKNEMSVNQQEEDSAKKKRKYTKDSLTDRLSRLIGREKSSIRFWHHSLKEGTFDDTNRNSSTMLLLSVQRQCTVYISRCLILAGIEAGSVCRTVFSLDTVHKLSLKAGVVVEIFPPWQQLVESGGEKTYLCTHFVRIAPSSTNMVNTVVRMPDEAKSSVTVSATWKCPCSHGQFQPAKVCPAAMFPVAPTVLNQTTDTSAVPHPPVKLLSFGGLNWPPSGTIQERLTLLESMERNRNDGACLPTFVATVLRVFRQRVLKTRKIRHQLLLEDSSGTIILATLPEDHVNKTSVTRLEGKSCYCSGLALSSRTNRDKQPSLFSVVDVSWAQRFPQSGSEASDCLHPLKTPNFAYVLESAAGLKCEFVLVKGDDEEETSAQEMITLDQLPQINPGSRITFLSRLVVKSRSNEHSGSQTAYVFDGSTDQAGNTALHRLEVGADCVLDSHVSVALFRDVLVRKDCLYCDSFTLVLGQSAWQHWNVAPGINRTALDRITSCSIRLPLPSQSSKPGDLVSAQGVISSVDDSTAYSWEECDECGSDKLATLEETGLIYCTICQRQVDSPRMRMKMEVNIDCTSLPPDVSLKIDLSQRTIEGLLPSEGDEEGYDIDQVINQEVRCQVCLVQSWTTDGGKDSSLIHLVELDC